jgi:hypothetical protein
LRIADCGLRIVEDQARREERARTGRPVAAIPRPRRDATTRTIRRQLFTSLATSGMAVVRAWTRTAHVLTERRIKTTRGKSSRTTTDEARRMPRENSRNFPHWPSRSPAPGYGFG